MLFHRRVNFLVRGTPLFYPGVGRDSPARTMPLCGGIFDQYKPPLMEHTYILQEQQCGRITVLPGVILSLFHCIYFNFHHPYTCLSSLHLNIHPGTQQSIIHLTTVCSLSFHPIFFYLHSHSSICPLISMSIYHSIRLAILLASYLSVHSSLCPSIWKIATELNHRQVTMSNAGKKTAMINTSVVPVLTIYPF